MLNIYRFIGFCLCFFSSFAMACSCAHVSLNNQVSFSDNIFIVETYQIETIKQADEEKFSSGERRGYFKVLETLKGTSSGATYIRSAEKPICCMCQSQVKNNTQYLVFSSGSDIYLSSCGFTKAIVDPSEISEIIKTMVQDYKPTEIFSGIYISNKHVFFNDDGTKTKVLELKRDDYFAKMSRISFEGIRLASGKIMVISLSEERTLSEEEIKSFEEGKVLMNNR